MSEWPRLTPQTISERPRLTSQQTDRDLLTVALRSICVCEAAIRAHTLRITRNLLRRDMRARNRIFSRGATCLSRLFHVTRPLVPIDASMAVEKPTQKNGGMVAAPTAPRFRLPACSQGIRPRLGMTSFCARCLAWHVWGLPTLSEAGCQRRQGCPPHHR